MKTPIFYILSVLFLVSSASNASSFLGKAPESGIIISVNPEKIPSKSGESVLISGTIKYVKKSQANKGKEDKEDKSGGSDKKHGLLEEFKAQGIDIVGTFPSSAVDISSELTLESVSNNEIRFSYQSKSIVADDLNQFTLKVYNNHTNKGALKKLSVIQAKLERRLQLLANLKRKFESGKATQDAIAAIEKEIAKLSAITTKIAQKLNANENLMAENTYALQVDNLTSNYSKTSTVMSDFRFMVNSDIGSAIQGMKVNFKSQIVSLSPAKEDDDDDDDDGYLAECYFNNQIVSSQKISGPRKSVNIAIDYPSEKLNPANTNIFSIALYHFEDGVKGRRIGYLNYKVPVIADTIKPIWLSDSIPNNQDRYSQQLRTINIKAQDSFGRIDPSSFKLLANNQGAVKDLSQSISNTKFDDGAKYEFTGDLNPLDEGEYTLTAKISDLAGNQADDYNTTFRIDRTTPVVNTTLANNTLTNKTIIEVPITVSDLSPTATDIYVNNNLVMTTALKEFTASVTLTIEGQNKIRIESKDAAGNVALAKEVAIVRDTTPPVIANLIPANNSMVNKIYFPVSASSNEVLSLASVNNVVLSLSEDKKTVSGTYYSSQQGTITLIWKFVDIAGNETVISDQVTIREKLLIPELVSVDKSLDGQHLAVIGKINAVRPNAEVEVSFGFLGIHSYKTTALSNGSFNIPTDFFNDATLTVRDIATNEVETLNLRYQVNTTIAGIVKDTSGNPLYGATIRVLGSTASATTNASGAFQFDAKRTGDQILVVNGLTIVPTSDGSSRSFSETRIAINIGIGQNNVLERPIYLQPILHDGTEVQISVNTAATVESLHAPGSSLQIPAAMAVFPDGTSTGFISIVEIPSDKATIEVPRSAVPDKVLALEPSGLFFKERIQLTLPNDNQLPADSEMIIMSMNSKKGIWEVDGRAKVSADGNSVVTLPNEGISHFSLVYAVPISPVITEVKDPSAVGVDISQGSMSDSISLPFYKVLGQKVSPSLTYKSSWAAPTVVASNIFDIPTQETTFEYGAASTQHAVQRVARRVCGINGWSIRCWDRYSDYYIDAQINDNIVVKTAYAPESIKSQLFISKVASDKVSYENPPVTPVIVNISGAQFASQISTPVQVKTGIPNKSLISYGMSLKDPTTQQYLESGLYPTIARYQLKLKSMTLTTATRAVTTFVNGQLYNVQTSQVSKNETRILDQVLPADVNSNVIVQNKVNSPYGRGWNLNLAQKIINPSNNQILIEETDGSVNTYSLNDSISTVADGDSLGVSFTNVGSLAKWPKILTQKTMANGDNYVVEVNVTSSTPATYSLGKVETMSGQLGNSTAYVCPAQSYQGTFSTYYHPYKFKADFTGLVSLPNGSVYGINKLEHSLFKLNNQAYVKMAGFETAMDTISMPFSTVPNYCTGNNITCSAQGAVIGTYSCLSIKPSVCPPRFSCKPTLPPEPPNKTIGYKLVFPRKNGHEISCGFRQLFTLYRRNIADA